MVVASEEFRRKLGFDRSEIQRRPVGDEISQALFRKSDVLGCGLRCDFQSARVSYSLRETTAELLQ